MHGEFDQGQSSLVPAVTGSNLSNSAVTIDDGHLTLRNPPLPANDSGLQSQPRSFQAQILPADPRASDHLGKPNDGDFYACTSLLNHHSSNGTALYSLRWPVDPIR